MELRDLRMFCHLAHSLHFAKTSQAMHVSAPTLSRVIQRLEEEAGEALLKRDKRTVALTSAGQRYLQFAERVLDDWQQLSQALHQESAALSGSLRLFCSVTAAYSYLLELMTPFRQQYPLIEIHLKTGDPADAIHAVQTGDSDLAIAPMPDPLPESLAWQLLANAPLRWIAPTIPCAVRSATLGTDLDWSTLPLILPEKGLARDHVLSWFAQRDLQPHIHAEVAGHEAIVSMVALGFGIGAIPTPVLEHSPLRKQVRELSEFNTFAPYPVGLCGQAEQIETTVLQAFWSLVRQRS